MLVLVTSEDARSSSYMISGDAKCVVSKVFGTDVRLIVGCVVVVLVASAGSVLAGEMVMDDVTGMLELVIGGIIGVGIKGYDVEVRGSRRGGVGVDFVSNLSMVL
ncbi:hypothetical protein Tco_1574321, partial [Tanacetum coccineum]